MHHYYIYATDYHAHQDYSISCFWTRKLHFMRCLRESLKMHIFIRYLPPQTLIFSFNIFLAKPQSIHSSTVSFDLFKNNLPKHIQPHGNIYRLYGLKPVCGRRGWVSRIATDLTLDNFLLQFHFFWRIYPQNSPSSVLPETVRRVVAICSLLIEMNNLLDCMQKDSWTFISQTFKRSPC